MGVQSLLFDRHQVGSTGASAMIASRRPRPVPLAGLRALVTGGSSGIGAATARALAAAGMKVTVAGRDQPALQRVAADTGAAIIAGDLRDADCPRRSVEAAVNAYGGLDLLVANAGVGWAGPFASMTEADIDSLLDVNLRANAHLARAAIPHLAAGTGRLVFVGSIAGLVAVPGEAWYSATKAGLACMAEALRAELQPAGIAVTLVSPGVVDTAYFERRRSPYQRRHPQLISPQAVADTIVDAITYERDNVIVPGWLSLPVTVKVHFPTLYRLLAGHFS
jgi:NADP-dependent 3-hydroxy acid dehydrogenase YdfG